MSFITIGNIIGEGSFKTVYSCKITTRPMPTRTNRDTFAQELFLTFQKPINIEINKLCISTIEIDNKKKLKEFILQNKFANIGLAPSIYEIHSLNNHQYQVIQQEFIQHSMLEKYKNDNTEYQVCCLQERCEFDLVKYIANRHNNNDTFEKIVTLLNKLIENDTIHMDIKPDNTCLSSNIDGEFYLRALDFDPDFIFTIENQNSDTIITVENQNSELISYGRFFMLIQFLIVLASSKITFDYKIIDNFLSTYPTTAGSSSLNQNIISMIKYFLKNPQKIMDGHKNPVKMLIHYTYENDNNYHHY